MFTNLTPTPINFQYNNNNIQKKRAVKPNTAPIMHDTVSFGAVKKKEFEGIDLAVVQKFNAPVECFDSNNDLQNWAVKKAKAIANKDFGGRSEETKVQRKAMLKDWSDYVFNKNNAYTNTTALLILKAITKDLKPDNDNIPPVLNKDILNDCLYAIDKNKKFDPEYKFDLNKMYQNKLRTVYKNEIETDIDDSATKWVIIPSKKNDPENFEANVEKLKDLSNKTWFTKNNAKYYLEGGDFHIYLENGQPKIEIRSIGDSICQIFGEDLNKEIPLDYYDVIENHINETNLKIDNYLQTKSKSAKKLHEIRTDLKDAIKKNDVKTILNYFGIETEEDNDGYLTISEYQRPSSDFSVTFKDLGIDENKLFEKIKRIKGDACFWHTDVTDLGKLKAIDGVADFSHSNITDLGDLRSIGGSAYFENSKITNLGWLQSIGGDADFEDTNVKNLGNLRSIGGYTSFSYSKITDLGALKSIGGDAYFNQSRITDLGNLRSVGGNLEIRNSQLKRKNLARVKVEGEIKADFHISDLLTNNFWLK